MDMAHEREASSEEEVMAGELRRGPWTVEEDLLLVNYIAAHGEGRWNSLARSSGLKRTGKSCRLRWLNYLRPDLRRGNITPQEQLLILELHSRWGNRWSKIAQHLPGRTDNEIKNYWRTRVQKHAKQLKCDVNSQQFKDVMRYLWMPRLIERIQATATAAPPPAPDTPAASWHAAAAAEYCPVTGQHLITNLAGPEASSTTGSSSPSMDSAGAQPRGWPAPAAELEGASSFLQCGASTACHNLTQTQTQTPQLDETWSESLPSLGAGYDDIAVSDFEIGSLDVESFLVMDDLWYTQGV